VEFQVLQGSTRAISAMVQGSRPPLVPRRCHALETDFVRNEANRRLEDGDDAQDHHQRQDYPKTCSGVVRHGRLPILAPKLKRTAEGLL
jgi:hypothetical protein